MTRCLLATVLALPLLAACKAGLEEVCFDDSDCWSGVCAPVTDDTCMGVWACTLECTEHGDCRRLGSDCEDGSGLCSRCTPDGVCEVWDPKTLCM